MTRESAGIGEAGFSLIELIVVMAVFIVVIMIAGDSFRTILTHSGVLAKRTESNIEGIIGLEMLRHDLAQAGFGLPTGYLGRTSLDYNEAVSYPANRFNDAAKGSAIPRAIVAGNNLDGADTKVLDGTDYLALKGTPMARNGAAQRWTYVDYVEGGCAPRSWDAGESLSDDDNVIVLRRTVVNGRFRAELVTSDDTFSTKYNAAGLAAPFSPPAPGDTYFIYGISPDKTPRMPFNRTDYFVKRPASGDMPSDCAPNTGILYKATLNHGDDDEGTVNTAAGRLYSMPVLDCVADMQVVFGWDLDADGVVETYSDARGGTVSGGVGGAVPVDDAEKLREQLRIVKVYLLAQDGRRDRNYANAGPILVGDESEESLTRKWSLEDIRKKGWLNYRWKLYRIVVNPANLRISQM